MITGWRHPLEAGHERGRGQEAPVVADRAGHRQGRSVARRRILVDLCPGAVCTAPVPASSVTCSPRTTALPFGRGAAASVLERAPSNCASTPAAPRQRSAEGRLQEARPPRSARAAARRLFPTARARSGLRPQGDGLIRAAFHGVVVQITVTGAVPSGRRLRPMRAANSLRSLTRTPRDRR